jgi:hypothetical protein
MRIHKLFQTFGWVGALVIAAAFAQRADGSVIVDITQAGPNVDVIGSGTLNLAALTFEETASETAEIDPTNGIVVVGSTSSTSVDYYGSLGVSGPSSIGSGGSTGASSASNALIFGFDGNSGTLSVPHDYTSGTPLSSSNVYDSATLSSLGLTPGTYTWTWGSGPTADSFTVQVDASAPEPGSLFLVAAGAVSLLLAVLLKSNGMQPQKGSPER